MNQLKVDKTASQNEPPLSRRDWILLPLLGLLTIFLLAGSTELIARRMFTDLPTAGEDCLVRSDASTGVRGIPNSVCWEKPLEGKLTKYQFNSSGYRDNFDFTQKTPDTYRIVMVGGSIAGGFRVTEEQTIAALLPAELTRSTGHKIELYNEGMPWRSPQLLAHHFDDILAVKPDMILWLLTPIDVKRTSWNKLPEENIGSPSFSAKAWYRIKAAFDTNSSTAAFVEIFSHTRTAVLLKHFLYKSPSQYLKYSLMGTDYDIGFLKSDLSSEWKDQLVEFDKNAASLETQAGDAGIPLVAVLVPDRTQVTMISMNGDLPKGFDPYKFNQVLSSIILSHGGIPIDILPGFQEIPNPQLGYFAIDGHPNASGHAMLSKMLAKELTSGVIPQLKVATKSQSELEQGR
jgi:hypothetical protein